MVQIDDITQITQAISALEAQRGLLGDAVVDTALAQLREKLASLREQRPTAQERQPAAAQEKQPAAEQRKLVTILFSDLVDFTALSSSIDPEDLHHIINLYFKQWAAAIEKHGGTVEKYIGDAVMAVFGLESTQEDEPERAISAALEMRQALETLNQEMQAALALPLAMRVGIHTGPVMVSLLGERKGQDFVVVGDTVNLASRLQGAAPSGGIIISHDTYRHVRGLFDLEPLDPVQVKGKAEAIPAYLVKQAKQRVFRMDSRGVEGIETRLVGRQAELQQLQEALEQTLQTRKTRVVLVVGEAGIGKSRLMDEFNQWVDLRPETFRYFKGRASPSMHNLPYSLLRDLFAFRFQIADSDAPQALQEKIERGIGEFDYGETPDETRLRAYIIGRLFGYKFENNPVGLSLLEDPLLLREQAVTYLVDYFQRLSEIRPIVILLEDLHWIDDSSQELLAQLIERLPDLPVLIVGAARPTVFERLSKWGQGGGAYTLLNLQPLSRRDNLRLVNEILKKVEQLPQELQELIVERAEGNPFFTEELIQMFIEDGVIIPNEDHWQVIPAQLASVQVPPTLVEVLQARFETLSPEEQVLLQRASVLGRVFWDAALQAMERDAQEKIHLRPHLGEGLTRLSGRGIILPWQDSTFSGAHEYHFKHALQRDVTYESVLKRRRRIYHAYAAAWLEDVTQRSQRSDEYAGLIAEHYDLAGEQQPAREWYLRAGDLAADRYANAEAVHCFTRCLELWPEHDLPGKADLHFKRLKVYDTTANRPAQQNDLRTLEGLVAALEEQASQEGDAAALEKKTAHSWQARLSLQWWRFYDALGETQKAIAAAQRAVELARAVGDRELEADGLLLWGASSWKLPDFATGQAKLEQALALARQLKLPQIEADCLRHLGIIYEYLGQYGAGEAHYHSAWKIYQEIGSEQGMSMALNSLGSLQMDLGDFEQARSFLERSLTLKRKMGHRRGEHITLHNLGNVEHRLGHYVTARQYFEQTLRFGREIQDREGEADALLMLGVVAMRLGDFHHAQEQLEQAIAAQRAIQSQIGECVCLRALGQLALDQEKFEAAQQYSQEACALAQDADLRPEHLAARMIDGYARLGTGQVEPALEIFMEVLDASLTMDAPGLVQEARAGAALALLAAGLIQPAVGMVEEVLDFLDFDNSTGVAEISLAALDRIDNSFWVLYTGCQVFAAAQDQRAAALLEFTATRLKKLACELGNEDMRQTFLAIPVHQKIAARQLDPSR